MINTENNLVIKRMRMLKKCLCIMIFNSRNAINMWDFREKEEGTAHSVYRLTCRHSITRVYNQGLVRTLP